LRFLFAFSDRFERYGDFAPTDVVTCAAVYYGQHYEPKTPKEKWLMRIAYWGTIIVVAFALWEYVKAM
jgi:hypothetical protein